MLSKADNELLCRVEGDAPMGQLMRQYWTPVCLIEEVSEPDGPPVKARILGEDLVVFRDTQGRVGVLDEHCPHRRASLVFGRNENCGLRCLYHGWKIDVEGVVVEMAAEPEANLSARKLRHRAYPTREWGGMVWAFFGPRERVPEFQPPRWAPHEGVRVSTAKVIIPCNWAQVIEGSIDSSHSSSLHSSDMVPATVDGAKATEKLWLRPSTDKSPRLQVQRTPYGFRYAALRRPIKDAETHDYVRASVFVAPATTLIPPNNLYNVANTNVPADDTSTVFYFIAWGHPAHTPETETWRKFLRQTVGIDLDSEYRPLRGLANYFMQDRQAMKAGNFTGIKGFPNQDLAMWVSMGPIADRSRERIGTSDQAIVEFRRRMVEAVRAFQRGEPAIGTGEQAIPEHICSFQAMMPKTTDWRDSPTQPVWDSGGPELEPSYSVRA
jgi:phthalate 4,5-dioxygenase oxygenase subunit